MNSISKITLMICSVESALASSFGCLEKITGITPSVRTGLRYKPHCTHFFLLLRGFRAQLQRQNIQSEGRPNRGGSGVGYRNIFFQCSKTYREIHERALCARVFTRVYAGVKGEVPCSTSGTVECTHNATNHTL